MLLNPAAVCVTVRVGLNPCRFGVTLCAASILHTMKHGDGGPSAGTADYVNRLQQNHSLSLPFVTMACDNNRQSHG